MPEGPRTDGERPSPPVGSAEAREVDPRLSERFADDFERESLGQDWRALSHRWRVTEGQLCVSAARNRGVWLRRRLPANVRVAFDARSDSEEGDLKAEMFGDGLSGADGDRYDDATGYVLIFGGWHNSLHVLARHDEHGDDRLETSLRRGTGALRSEPVKPHRAYRIRIERSDGKTLRWFVDGELVHELQDDDPLSGVGHDHFAFNNWNAPVCFDNLEVEPL